MSVFRRSNALRRGNESVDGAQRFVSVSALERFLPNRANRWWWLGGTVVAVVLTFLSLPATFQRRVPDVAATERAREVARKNTIPIYTRDESELVHAQVFFRRVQDVLDIPRLTPEERIEALNRLPLTRFYLSNIPIETLLQNRSYFAEIERHTLDILERLLSRSIVLGGYGAGSLRAELAAYFDPKYTTQWSDVDSMTILIQPEQRIVPISELLTWEDSFVEAQRLARTLPLDASFSEESQQAIRSLVLALCRPFIRPNLFFNAEATRAAQQVNADAVPMVFRSTQQRPIRMFFGTFVVIALVAIVSGLFISSQPALVFRNYRPLAAWGVILFAALVLLYFGTRIVLRQRDVDYPILVVPVALAASLASILMGIGYGAFSTVFLSAIAGLMTGVSSPTSTAQMWTLVGSGLVAAYTMSDVHNRRDIVLAGFYVTLATAFGVFGVTLIQGDTPGKETLLLVLWAFASGLIVTASVPGVLPPFEYLSGTATDMELLELTDMNHPLLLEMQQVAPGTFNHSLNVGRLAEGAAEVIGTNALLARVGSLFHDIGKMKAPSYFIENQEGGTNPHDRLSPNVSAQVLIAHVEDGIEMAKEHKLPRAVIDLIPQHHGTSLIRFFYHKAAEHGDVVDESAFRYPGPKPQTKVGAILLLADSIEAAANARFKHITGLTPRDCENHVASIIHQHQSDGQLDECDLTQNDLRVIAESFQRMLLGMYHSRIDYPKETPLPALSDEVRPSDATPV
jgi:hypothetical protein